MNEMRRKDRAISEEEAKHVLINGEYGILSTLSENGEPYGVPLSYCVVEDSIYFHCAVEGKKLEHFNHNKLVSFCVVGKTEVLPKKFSTKYESIIISGNIEEVFDIEKQIGMEGLIHKYSPDHFEKGLKYISAENNETKVFKITVNHISGKARKQ